MHKLLSEYDPDIAPLARSLRAGLEASVKANAFRPAITVPRWTTVLARVSDQSRTKFEANLDQGMDWLLGQPAAAWVKANVTDVEAFRATAAGERARPKYSPGLGRPTGCSRLQSLGATGDRDHTHVRSVWFNGDMFIGPYAAMLAGRGADARATPFEQRLCVSGKPADSVSPSSPGPRELAFVAATMRSGSLVGPFARRPFLCIQSQQTTPVARRGPLTRSSDHLSRCGTFCSSLTCTDAHSCPKCPVPARRQSHVAPVTGCIPDGQEDGFAEALRLREGLRSPLPPVHRIVLVLQQVRAGGMRESVRHHGRLS